MGSYSVVQCVRCLIGQPLYCSAASAGLWEERGYGDGQEEGEEKKRGEAAERGWRSGEAREERTFITGLPAMCQARCEDYP